MLAFRALGGFGFDRCPMPVAWAEQVSAKELSRGRDAASLQHHRPTSLSWVAG